MKRRGWSISVNLYWCSDINVPILDFPIKEGNCKRLILPPPGDARIALPTDIERINKAIKESLGLTSNRGTIWDQKIVLLVKEPYIDERRRIIVGGENIGSIYYNPYLGKHIYRPSELAAYILLHNKVVDTIKLNNVSEGDLVKVNGFSEYILIAEISQEEKGGVLEKVRDNLYRIKKIFDMEKNERKYDQFTNIISKRTDINDLLKYNDYALYYYKSRAIKFLHTMSSKIRKNVIVSFSGGKDSLATLHLTLESGIEPILMFNNTGIELPETIETVERTVEKYNLRIEIADAGNSFWTAIRSFGPPARNYRWCCKVVKLVPFARLTRRKWPLGALNILGQRAYESYDRARSPKVWRNQWAPHVLSIAPIHEWPQFILWLYIHKHKLVELVNPLYYKGFERIGCYLCPASTLAEFHIVSKTHPELWNKWVSVLRSFNCSETCIKLGLWRWLGPSSVKKQLMQKTRLKYSWKHEYLSHLPNKPIRIEVANDHVYIEFEERLNKGIYNQLPIIQGINKNDYIETPFSIIRQTDNKIIIKYKKELPETKKIEHVLDVLKLAYRGDYCAGCRSCELWCPTNAIRVEKTPIVDPNKCISCFICVKECPLAELTVDKILSSIILNKPDGWRRPGKIKRKETINIIKNLTLKQIGASTSEKHRSNDYFTDIISNFDEN